MIRSRIVGTGRFLPEKVLTNVDLESMMDTSDELIRQRTGIHQRHVAEEGTGSSRLGIPAAQRALAAANVDPMDVDLVICCTMTPDFVFPATACLIQDGIGAKAAAAYDINAACSGFVYSLSIADAHIRSGMHKTVLIVAAEMLTAHINWQNRDTAVLFGDGAGAAVVQACEGDHGILTNFMAADGSDLELLMLRAGGSRVRITPENVAGPDRDIVMRGKELFKRAVRAFGDAIERALADSRLTAEEVDVFVPHQANSRIIFTAAKRLGFPEEKIFLNIDHVGNTVAASIPIALDEAVEKGVIQEGNVVLLAGFGAGLTWGSSMVRW